MTEVEVQEMLTEEKVDASTVVKKVTNRETARIKAQTEETEEDKEEEEADHLQVQEAMKTEEEVAAEAEEMTAAMVVEEESIPEIAEATAHTVIRKVSNQVMIREVKREITLMTAETASSLISEESLTMGLSFLDHQEMKRTTMEAEA